MIIVHGTDPGRPTEERGPTFTGQVWADPVLPTRDGVTINTVCFTPGARTFWHHHEHGQILLVIAGRGRICTAGESPQELTVGDVVWVPPGERHWHGATETDLMTHVAISLGTTHWAEEVSDPDDPGGPDAAAAAPSTEG